MIWRRVRSGWIRRAIVMMRWTRTTAYVLITLSSVASVIRPPASIAAASEGRTVGLAWAGLMGISAAFCAVGALTDRWVGEYIGLIPLSAAAGAFSLSAFGRGQSAWAGAFFLLAFFAFLFGRWQEVALLRTEADRRARERQDGSTP